MGLKRSVGLSTALSYRGGAPMWTFILHRVGGIVLFVFFSVYFLVLAGVRQADPFFYNRIFQMSVLLFGIFHAVNGLRIAILDIWPALLDRQPQAIRVQFIVLALIYAYVAFVLFGA